MQTDDTGFVLPPAGPAGPSAEDTARWLLNREIMPVPVPFGQKNPNRPGWERERYDRSRLSAFAGRVNVGMRLGHIVDDHGNVYTNRFLDVDLDCPEAVAVAPFYLPPTGMIWGRASNPRSHYGYRLRSVEGARTVQTFTDPLRRSSGSGDASMLELRFSGHTLAPGSVNAEGPAPETVRLERDVDGTVGDADFAHLLGQAGKVYAGALISRYWSEGVRHVIALPLAGMLCLGGLTEDDAKHFLRAVCAAARDTEVEDRVRAVETTYARAGRGEPLTAAGTLDDVLPDKRLAALVRKWLHLGKGSAGGDIGPDGYQLSDIGNAERFAARYAGRALYCDDKTAWYLYDVPIWHEDRTNSVYRLAMDVVADFRARLADRSQPDLGNTPRDAAEKHAKASSQGRAVSEMIKLARALLPVVPEEFDAQSNLLNTLDGVVVLDRTTGKHYLRAHRAEDLLTKVWRAHYQPDATHPDVVWYQVTFVPERDRWEFIEQCVGYSLDGIPKRFSFQLLGPSHAGKSMLLRILYEHAGPRGASYAGTLDADALRPDPKGGGRPRTDLVELRGSRLLTIPEVGRGEVFDARLFKTVLSGGDTWKGRGAYERRTQSFIFTAALWTSGNDAYGVRSDDPAAQERVHVIRLDHPLPLDARNDARENEVVDAERTGTAFLACWLRGFSRLYGENGGVLRPPESVREATEEVRMNLDPYERMLDALIDVTGDPNDGVPKADLNRRAAAMALDEEGWRRWGNREKERLSQRLEGRGLTLTQSSARFEHRPYWRGIRWKQGDDEPENGASGAPRASYW